MKRTKQEQRIKISQSEMDKRLMSLEDRMKK